MIFVWRVVGVLCLLILVSCSTSEEKEKARALKPAKLVEFESTMKLTKVWSASAGRGQDKRYTRLEPMILGDRVFAADIDGTVFAFDKTNGKRLWREDTEMSISGAIGGTGNELVFGTYNGEVSALSNETGERLWTAEVSSEVLAPPVSNGEVVVAQSIDGGVFGFNAKTGDLLWSYDHATPVLTLRGTSKPVIVSSQVILAFDNGQMISLGVDDGSLKWEARISQPKGRTELERIIDIDGTPIVDGGMVYAATYHGTLAAFTRAQGRMVWQQDLSTHQNLTISRGRIFASSEASSVVAFDAQSGAVLWKNDQLSLRNIGAPAIIGDYVAVIDHEGYMHLMSQLSGEFAYRFKPAGKGFRSPIMSYDDQLLVLSDNGKLSSYRIQ